MLSHAPRSVAFGYTRSLRWQLFSWITHSVQPLQNHRGNNSKDTLSPYSQRFLRTEGTPVSICPATSVTKAIEIQPRVPAARQAAPDSTKVVVWICRGQGAMVLN